MCVSQEFTAANIAGKLWAIPRVKQYLSSSSASSLPNTPRNPLVTKATCCTGPPKATRKNSLNFVLNDDSDDYEPKRRNSNSRAVSVSQNCLVQITVLDDAQLFECIFSCYDVNRCAQLTFDIHQFLLGSDGRRNNNNSFLLAKQSLVRITFGRIVSPGTVTPPPALPPPPCSPREKNIISINCSSGTIPIAKSNSSSKAQRIAPAPTTPLKPMTSEERNDAARREKDQLRKIRKREAAARSNKRRSEAKRKKTTKVVKE